MSPIVNQAFPKLDAWCESTRGLNLIKEGGKKERKNRKRSPKLKQTFFL